MRELLAELPPDAVEQINAKIPLDKKTGQPKYPKNKALNGYVQQLLMAAWEKEDKLAKLTAAHNKRVASKEDEMQALRAQLTKEREKELQKLSTVHQRQLKARAPAPPQRARPQRAHPSSARAPVARARVAAS